MEGTAEKHWCVAIIRSELIAAYDPGATVNYACSLLKFVVCVNCDNFSLTVYVMKIVKFLALFVVLAVSSITAVAQDKNAGSIKGKVRVEKGSAAGVSVILRKDDQELRRVETDRKGAFTMARVPVGTYGLTFRKAGLAVGSIENVEVKAGKTRSLGDHLFLAVDEGSIAFIRGSVFNEGGRSVPGMRVELSRIVSDTAVDKLDSRITGETGEFVFRVPAEVAKYRVTLKADRAELVSKDVEVDSALVYRVALTYKPKP